MDSLRIELGAGDINIREIAAGKIRVQTGAGQLQAIGLRGDLEAQIGAGKVAVYSHSGTANCHSGTGDILLDIAEAPPGEYKVDVGIGRAELRLPAGLDVHVATTSALGRGNAAYPDAGPSATRRASVQSGIGEAIIRPREPGTTPAAPGRGPAPEPDRRQARRVGAAREEDELRVLQLLQQGRITPAEAADLIAALHGSARPPSGDSGSGTNDGDSPDGGATAL
jgi:hypothetical protein